MSLEELYGPESAAWAALSPTERVYESAALAELQTNDVLLELARRAGLDPARLDGVPDFEVVRRLTERMGPAWVRAQGAAVRQELAGRGDPARG